MEDRDPVMGTVPTPMATTEDIVETFLQKLRTQRDVPNLYTPTTWNQKYTLRPFQKVGAAHLIVMKRFVLGDPTGSGKTVQALLAWAVIKEKKAQENQLSRLWIITTKSAVKQWAEETEKFLPSLHVHQVQSGHNQTKRLQTYQAGIEDPTGAVTILNWTQLVNDWPEIKKIKDPLPWLSQTQIIFDEAQKMANPETKIGKTAREVSVYADRVHGLTATLVRNKAQDAHTVIQTICPDTMSRELFELLYCEKENQLVYVKGGRRRVSVITGYKNLEDYAQKISHNYLGRTDDEIEGERPEVVFMKRTTTMGPDQTKVYREAEKGLLMDNPPDDGIPAMVHAQQAANNPEIFTALDPYPFSVKTTDNAKADLLKELLDDELKDQPLILYSPLETTITAYQRHLNHIQPSPVRITGKEDEAQREAAREAFQQGKTNVIMITDAGSEALNLQRAKHFVFISRPWSPGQYIQAIGRARRFGSTHASVTVWHLEIEDTIDSYVDAVLSEKFAPVEEIVKGRGKLLPEDKVLPKEIAQYARRKRLNTRDD